MNFRQGFAAGAIVVLVMAAIAFVWHGQALTAAIARADRRSDSIATVLAAQRDSARDALEDQAAASRAADAESRRARHVAERLGALIGRVEVRSDPDTTGTGDTVTYVGVSRAGDSTVYRVPLWIAEDRDTLISAILRVKLAWEAERSARRLATEVTIPRLAQIDTTGAALVASQQTAIALRDATHRPRCGAKCGSLLTLAAITILKLSAR